MLNSDILQDMGVNRDLFLTLQKYEEGLMQSARLAQVNALLTLVDPAYVLPAPAVGLVQIMASSTLELTERYTLRSLAPQGSVGEVLLTLVEASFVHRPWSTSGCEWIVDEETGVTGTTNQIKYRSGIRFDLVRQKDADRESGSLRLFIDCDPLLNWILGSASATINGNPVSFEQVKPEFHLDPYSAGFPWSVYDNISALYRNLFDLKLPKDFSSKDKISVEIRFLDGIPCSGKADKPVVLTNVAVVWNSIDHQYPEPSKIRKAVGNSYIRDHKLTTDDLGTGWICWCVTRVGLANRSDVVFHCRQSIRCSPTDDGFGRDYYLAISESKPDRIHRTPMDGSGSGTSAAISIVLTTEAREKLEIVDGELSAGFRATQGALVRNISDKTKFEVLDRAGFTRRINATAELIGGLIGGTDGILWEILEKEPANYVSAMIGIADRRTIGDILQVLQQYYGMSLEIVDERDLLRFRSNETALAPLTVRVRFKPPWLKKSLRNAVLMSAEQFLNRYLSKCEFGGLRLVDEDEDQYSTPV